MDIITQIISQVNSTLNQQFANKQQSSTGISTTDISAKLDTTLIKGSEVSTTKSSTGSNIYQIISNNVNQTLGGQAQININSQISLDKLAYFFLHIDNVAIDSINEKQVHLNINGKVISENINTTNGLDNKFNGRLNITLNNPNNNQAITPQDSVKIHNINSTTVGGTSTTSHNIAANISNIDARLINILQDNFMGLDKQNLSSQQTSLRANIQITGIKHFTNQQLIMGDYDSNSTANKITIVDGKPTLSGTVIANTQSNLAVIKTAYGDFVISNQPELKAATKVTFTITDISNNKTPLSEIINSPDIKLQQIKTSINLLSAKDSPLNQLMASYDNINISSISPIANMLPSTHGKQNYAKSLWFISSILADVSETNEVNFSQALPQNKTSTDKSTRDIFSEIFKSFRQVITDEVRGSFFPNQNYQHYAIPFYDGQQTRFTLFHIEDKPEAENNSIEKDSKKFFVQFSQEDYGHIVIAGLIQRDSQNFINNINLLLSSENNLTNSEQEELRNIIINTGQLLGVNINLSYGNAIEQLMKVCDEGHENKTANNIEI